MPFKIYAYTDPYRLNKAHFWDEVNSVPHLCVSQTLVNGLRDLFEFESVLMPIDNVLSILYAGWHRNVEKQIAQYSILSQVLREWKESLKIDESLYRAFKHNQSDLLAAIRLLVELNIDHSRLYNHNAYPEQCLLIELYEMASQEKLTDAFSFPEVSDPRDISESIRLAFEKDRDRYIEEGAHDSSSSRINWYDQVIKKLNATTKLSRIVIHGLHQFTPLQLRFIYALHEGGVEVIFLFNYQKQFKEIYSTWDYVYRQFDVPIELDRNVTEYPFLQDCPSHALASRMALLLNPGLNHHLAEINWSEPLKKVQFIEFDNVTEFAGYVASFFEKAGNRIEHMSEHVYSAGSEVHDLLKIYYPEKAGDRHFLAYPVGQFFAGLYKMWDPISNQIKLEMSYLRECLSAGILGSVPAEKLTAIFHNTRHFFEDIIYFDQFKSRMQSYINRYEEIQQGTGFIMKWMRNLSIYNPEYVKLDDLTTLLETVETLNETAKRLFETSEGQDGFLTLKSHFERLEEFIRQRLPETFVLQEEKRLIEDLLARFESVKQGSLTKGSIEDLRMGIYYYLKQKEKEPVDWIVRNFEQIDGDILRSSKQEENRCYHFACLSDQDMNKKVDDLLPWPLTDYFITKSYTPVEQHFQVYYAALGEYSNFLKYALFYGMCFNRRNVRLSYVRSSKNDIVQPYFLLRMMGLEPKRWSGSTLEDVRTVRGGEVPAVRQNLNITVNQREQFMDFVLCPYRFFLNFTFKGGLIPNSLFLYQHLYVNLLIAQVWRKIQCKPVELEEARISHYIEISHKDMARFFPFWSIVNDFNDLNNQALNYIKHRLISGRQYKPYDQEFIKIRLLFRKARFDYEDPDELDTHPYNAANRYYRTYQKNGKSYKYVSLPTINTPVPENLKNAIQEYLAVDSMPKEHPGDWCTYCSQKGTVCLKPYLL